MGIGKTICALGEYDFFATDYISFAKIISDLFQVNVNLSFISYISGASYIDYFEMDDEFHDFNKELTYQMTVHLSYSEEDHSQSKNQQKVSCYELMIPIELDNETEFVIEFNYTGIFQLRYIPFSNAWQFFIQDIVENNFNLTVFNISKIRNTYIEVLSCFNCKEVILWTDAYYKTEVMLDSFNEKYEKLSLIDVMNSLINDDNVTIYLFAEVVNQEKIIKSQSYQYYDVVLLDRFCDIIMFR